MDKVIIFGTSIFASVVYQVILQDRLAEVVAFTLNEEYMQDHEHEGLPVIPFEHLRSHYNMAECKIAIAIGYKKMNDVRERIYNSCKDEGYSIFTVISNKAILYSHQIGEGSIILPNAYIGPYTEIGKSVIIWNDVAIGHHNTIDNFTNISGGTCIGGGAKIGKNCFIGSNSTISNEIQIGDRTFIGAASFMTKSTEGGLGFMGNPASNPRGIKGDFLIKFLK